jgi:hypothetical protein
MTKRIKLFISVCDGAATFGNSHVELRIPQIISQLIHLFVIELEGYFKITISVYAHHITSGDIA